MIKIAKKIVGYSVLSNGEDVDSGIKKEDINEDGARDLSQIRVTPVDAEQYLYMDIDPTLDSRPTPDGFIDAVRYKQLYIDPTGTKRSLYIVVGFERRKAMKAGEEFIIEHPVEVFAPAKEQIADTAAMVLASRCLRSGTAPSDVVNDFASVALPETYYVRRPDGKQKIVNSMSAVVGEAMKHALIHRGLMDEYGNDVPYHERPRFGTDGSRPFGHEPPGTTASFDMSGSAGAAKVSVSKEGNFRPMNQICPDCSADEWVMLDGCRTCSCGYSKCG